MIATFKKTARRQPLGTFFFKATHHQIFPLAFQNIGPAVLVNSIVKCPLLIYFSPEVVLAALRSMAGQDVGYVHRGSATPLVGEARV